MVTPADGESERHDAEHWAGLEEACAALVQAMAEPLTAIGNYLEAARTLSHRDAAAVHAQLGEILDKAHEQVLRANGVLHEMRQVLQKKKA